MEEVYNTYLQEFKSLQSENACLTEQLGILSQAVAQIEREQREAAELQASVKQIGSQQAGLSVPQMSETQQEAVNQPAALRFQQLNRLTPLVPLILLLLSTASSLTLPQPQQAVTAAAPQTTTTARQPAVSKRSTTTSSRKQTATSATLNSNSTILTHNSQAEQDSGSWTKGWDAALLSPEQREQLAASAFTTLLAAATATASAATASSSSMPLLPVGSAVVA